MNLSTLPQPLKKKRELDYITFLVVDEPVRYGGCVLRRPRRNRKSPSIRSLVQETRLLAKDFIQPFFILDGERRSIPIESMPGISRYSVDQLLVELEKMAALGISTAIFFPVIPASQKDENGSTALDPKGVLPLAIAAAKRAFPALTIIADVALDPYTSHGHDGLVDAAGRILNDETVEVLKQSALLLAEAGVDIVAPSDMMDGRVGSIRRALDDAGFLDVSIMAYSAKYASAFYGPFRDALGSAPRFGDKKTYQMDPANAREAVLEVTLDEEEGADIVLVKPALAYLDVIHLIRQKTLLPLAAYHVSGEYAMVKAAAKLGWLDEDRAMLESLMAIKRAGSDMIISYAAMDLLSKGLLTG